MAKVVKKRNWAFVVYPESVAPNWIEQLKLSGLKCAISPLHDKDTETGQADEHEKKAHWHVIVCYDGPVTLQNVTGLSVDRLKATNPVFLDSVRGYYRYLTHADHPDKYQYNAADIQHIGGFDIGDHTDMTLNEKLKILAQVEDFVDDNDIREYSRLSKALRQAGLVDWWRVVATNTFHLSTYITSRRHELEAIEEKENRPPVGGGRDD